MDIVEIDSTCKFRADDTLGFIGRRNVKLVEVARESLLVRTSQSSQLKERDISITTLDRKKFTEGYGLGTNSHREYKNLSISR